MAITDSQTYEDIGAHHKFQRRLLRIKYYDKVSNVEVRKRTGMAKLEEINQIIKKMARARDKDGGRNARRILLGGVNAPLLPEAKKI